MRWDIQIIIAAILNIATTITGTEQTDTWLDWYTSIAGIRCSLCPPGTYKHNDCQEDWGSAICKVCPIGQFQTYCNQALSCEPCSVTCPWNDAVISQVCSLYADIRCECEEGRFLKKETANDGLCLPFSACPEGHGLVKNGTTERDTVCERCIHGKTFSSDSSFEHCVNCTQCKKYKWQCDITRDAVCGNNTTPDNPGGGNGVSTTNDKTILILVCSVIGVIIVVVILVITLTLIWRRRWRRSERACAVNQGGRQNALEAPEPPQSEQRPNNNQYHDIISNGVANGDINLAQQVEGYGNVVIEDGLDIIGPHAGAIPISYEPESEQPIQSDTLSASSSTTTSVRYTAAGEDGLEFEMKEVLDRKHAVAEAEQSVEGGVDYASLDDESKPECNENVRYTNTDGDKLEFITKPMPDISDKDTNNSNLFLNSDPFIAQETDQYQKCPNNGDNVEHKMEELKQGGVFEDVRTHVHVTERDNETSNSIDTNQRLRNHSGESNDNEAKLPEQPMSSKVNEYKTREKSGQSISTSDTIDPNESVRIHATVSEEGNVDQNKHQLEDLKEDNEAKLPEQPMSSKVNEYKTREKSGQSISTSDTSDPNESVRIHAMVSEECNVDQNKQQLKYPKEDINDGDDEMSTRL